MSLLLSKNQNECLQSETTSVMPIRINVSSLHNSNQYISVEFQYESGGKGLDLRCDPRHSLISDLLAILQKS